MSLTSGPIVYVEDDQDDVAVFEQALAELGIPNELKSFSSSNDALNYLLTTTDLVYLIFSDINLPGKNGMELKLTIDLTPELRRKSIPFIFFTTTANNSDIELAYLKMTLQGYFTKPTDFKQMLTLMQTIFDYWSSCKHPNII
jgi:CheY-like chemotaxis protein